MLSNPEETQTGVKALSWFVLRVRSNCERMTSTHLRDRGFEEFSPAYNVVAQWSDRKKITERFLFPGYVFCRLNPHGRLPVLTVPGAVNLVGFGAGPIPVPDEEIERVRTLVSSGLPVAPYPFLKVGQRVRLERGPLAGVEGILEQVKGTARLVVSINMLQRSVATEVERGWVLPLNDCTSPGGFATQHLRDEYRTTSARVYVS
jgi:transcriptional antiterminator NusG